jgi:hypothetical protein
MACPVPFVGARTWRPLLDATVTVPRDPDQVCNNHSPTGVCVIRIESSPCRPMVTIRMNRDIERVPTDQVRKVREIESAMRAVREFLATFVTGLSDQPPP